MKFSQEFRCWSMKMMMTWTRACLKRKKSDPQNPKKVNAAPPDVTDPDEEDHDHGRIRVSPD